jgi:hypothetical protein
VFWRRNSGISATQASELIDLLRAHGKELKQLREDIDDLGDKHERLRGKFYAKNGAGGTGDPKPSDLLPGPENNGRPRGLRPLLSDYWTPGTPAKHER